jgi:hypothetical protein
MDGMATVTRLLCEVDNKGQPWRMMHVGEQIFKRLRVKQSNIYLLRAASELQMIFGPENPNLIEREIRARTRSRPKGGIHSDPRWIGSIETAREFQFQFHAAQARLIPSRARERQGFVPTCSPHFP